MNKALSRTPLFLTLLLAAGCQPSDKTPITIDLPGMTSEASRTQKVLATVNGVAITEAQLLLYKKNYRKKHPLARTPSRQELLQEMIDQQLLVQLALKSGIGKKPEVYNQILFFHNTLLADSMRAQVLKTFRITDQDIEGVYLRRFQRHGARLYKTRNILVPSWQQATSIRGQLQQGGNFAELARKHSIGPARSNGGALKWFREDEVLKSFASNVKKLRPGQVSPPFKTRYGWHIVLLEEIKDTPAPPLKSVAKKIYLELLREKYLRYVKKLHNQAKIEVK